MSKFREAYIGDIITVYGGANGTITIPKALSNVKLDDDIVLDGSASSVQLLFVDGIWYKYTG